MNAIFVLSVFFLSSYGQKYPEFFNQKDLEGLGFMAGKFNPNPIVKPHERWLTTQPPRVPQPVTSYPNFDDFEKPDYSVLIDLRERARITGHEYELKEFSKNFRNDQSGSLEQRIKKHMKIVQDWANTLPDVTTHSALRSQMFQTPEELDRGPKYGPSAGMNAYWAHDGRTKTKKSRYNPQELYDNEHIIKAALKTFEDYVNTNSELLKPTLRNNSSIGTKLRSSVPDPVKDLNVIAPTTDDFSSPIRWVPIDSNETSDGLARVTDPETGQNRQYHINGTIFVPITDYNLERIGLNNTTTLKPILTTASSESILRTVVRNVDLKHIDNRDWLVFEAALGGNTEVLECDTEGCQARCRRFGCESMCTGDTCSSGCVGRACNTFCKGPGCLSMCVGESCSARCMGIACESRCRGKECDATCRSFQCRQVVEGRMTMGGGTWGENYPQYDMYTDIKNE